MMKILERVLPHARALQPKVAPLAPLLARITLGVVFVGTGWGKLNNLDKITAYFVELGIPAASIQAPFVSAVEFVGGALVILGLGTRVASAMLASTMIVALITAKRGDIHGFADLFGVIEWTYLVLFVWLALAGPGRLALDTLVVRRYPALKIGA